jgi:hypothetical protein
MKEVSISDLILQWYAEYSQECSSSKGTATVIPIKDMEDSFIVLFHSIKELGYSEEEFSPKHREQVLKFCRPASKKGLAQKKWDFKVNIRILKAKAAVFGSALKTMSESVSEETITRYHEAYKNLQEPKKYTRASSENEDTINIEDEQQEEFEESDNFKPLNRSKLKESIPEVSEDDSWIHNMAESYDE